MGKKVLVLSASPRKGGNSDVLCDQFISGAQNAGLYAEKIFLKDKQINYCIGCGSCYNGKKRCPQKDDMTEVLDKMIASAFRGVLESWNCRLEEFGGEEDHVHLLIGIHPALNISGLVNNLKSATSRKVRNQFQSHVAQFYWNLISGTVLISSAA